MDVARCRLRWRCTLCPYHLQETNPHPYVHPYFSVYFNHVVTGLFSAIMAAGWLLVTRQNVFVVLRAHGFRSLCGTFWVSAAFAAGLMYVG